MRLLWAEIKPHECAVTLFVKLDPICTIPGLLGVVNFVEPHFHLPKIEKCDYIKIEKWKVEIRTIIEYVIYVRSSISKNSTIMRSTIVRVDQTQILNGPLDLLNYKSKAKRDFFHNQLSSELRLQFTTKTI